MKWASLVSEWEEEKRTVCVINIRQATITDVRTWGKRYIKGNEEEEDEAEEEEEEKKDEKKKLFLGYTFKKRMSHNIGFPVISIFYFFIFAFYDN